MTPEQKHKVINILMVLWVANLLLALWSWWFVFGVIILTFAIDFLDD